MKIARLTFFFSGLARESDFLAVADLEALEVFEAVSFEEMFFGIGITRFIPTALHLSSGGGAVTEGSVTGTGGKAHSSPAINHKL